MTRRALGRGLGALLSADTSSPSSESFEIEIDQIDPSPVQPRSNFDEAKLKELASSIEANGVVQPLVVRTQGARFELIAGERRWRAAQLAGLTRIPAVVREVPDDKVLELALIENIQREDLNAIEEAQAYKKLIETIGLTQEQLAERVGRDRSYITNYLRLLRLPKDIQRLVQDGKVSTGHARTLLGVEDADIQRRVARKIIEQGLSVRETERIIRRLASTETRGDKQSQPRKENDANVRAAEAKLRRALGTRVQILQAPSGSGRITIEFYNGSDLDRLYQILVQRAQAVGQ